ncbi:MAG TPA: YggT family protein [Spirochaetaceae bacterium]|nr:YggT family protein [Spirochaetaceae bacterium]
MVLTTLMRILGAFSSIYMLLCSLRVFMTWMPGIRMGRAEMILSSLVDPYLGAFSRIRLFRTERFDFSPIAALAVLSVLNRVFSTLAYSGRISLGFVLGLLLGAAWSALSFVLSFLLACAVLRIVAFMAGWNTLHPIWLVIDSILNPLLFRINRILYRGRAVQYRQGLFTGLLAILLLRMAGGALVGILNRLLISLPF